MFDTLSHPPTTDEPLDEVSGRALVESWRLSGLTGAAYCRMHNIRAQRLHYWRERLGYPIKVVGGCRPTDLLPSAVTMPSATAVRSPTAMPSAFVQVVVEDVRPVTDVGIVVGGACIRVQRGFDPDLLRSVVVALQVGV